MMQHRLNLRQIQIHLMLLLISFNPITSLFPFQIQIHLMLLLIINEKSGEVTDGIQIHLMLLLIREKHARIQDRRLFKYISCYY